MADKICNTCGLVVVEDANDMARAEDSYCICETPEKCNDMINCTVEVNKIGHLTVTFGNGKTIYLQSENERAQFGVACGIIEAFENWSGASYHLEDGWWNEDFEAITQCPDYYINSAE